MAPTVLVLCVGLFGAASSLGVTRARLSGGPDLDEWKKGKENEKEAEKAAAAKQAKMAAVDKVVSMLESVESKVLEEGEKEAATYNKFACFCKDTTTEKNAAIEKGNTNKNDLSSDIDSLSSTRDDLDNTISGLVQDISDTNDAMKSAQDDRNAENKEFEKNAADLKSALDSLENAIKVLKSSTQPSLVQFQGVAKTVQTAALLADALGINSASAKNAIAAFVQQPSNGNEVPFEDYKFHSDGIIKTLEGLLNDFKSEKNDIDAEEVKSNSKHEIFMQGKTDLLKRKEKELSDAKKQKSVKVDEIAAASQELSVVAATLLDDQQYLMELAQMCTDTAKTWDQRSRVRADELSMLTEVIGVIKGSVTDKTKASTIRFAQQTTNVRRAQAFVRNEEAMEEVEAEAEEAEEPMSFVQLSSHPAPEDGRLAVVNLLRTEGTKLKSTLLTSLASQIAADPFAKVKVLIQELIERLLQEASNEANQKGWCDKATKDAEQKRDYAAEAIEELNGQMARLEATRDKLAEELSELADEIQDLKWRRGNATELRNNEKQENNETVEEAEAGLEALNAAIDRLDKWYKTNKKEEVDLSFSQGPADDAPGAGFKIGEAYKGAQSESGGILGMLDVMKSDFERTISETEAAEEQAAADHRAFLTETGKSLAEKDEAEKEKKSQKGDAEDKLGQAEDNLDAQTETLETSLKELMELKPACVDTGMSYDDRVAAREDEIEQLKKALCVLQRYAEYGPDGAQGC